MHERFFLRKMWCSVQSGLFILLLTLASGFICACKKYLEKKPDSSVTSIQRLEDLQAILDNADRVNYEIVPAYLEASADDYFLTNQDFFYNNGSGEVGQAAYIWKYFIDEYADRNAWSQSYVGINLANICLEWVEKFSPSPVNPNQWNNIKGSALFIRAFNFLNLSFTYSKAWDATSSNNDLGIALRLGTDYDEVTVRATVAESYKQIIKDARESLLYLPAVGIHPLRPSKAAAYGLLARTYLSMRIYDSAGLYADSCLKIKSDLIDYNGDGDIVNPINGLNAPFRQFNKETIFYADLSTAKLNSLVNAGNIDTVLYSSYVIDDLRKIAFFKLANNGYQKFKGNYTQSYRFFGGLATDEMFLIRAECYARKGLITEAMADLNTLLIKRWKNSVSYPVVSAATSDEALKKILNERRKELLLRGLRWMDIKRLNKENMNIIPKRLINGETYLLPANNDRYALPIPQEIIDITKIPQNPGW